MALSHLSHMSQSKPHTWIPTKKFQGLPNSPQRASIQTACSSTLGILCLYMGPSPPIRHSKTWNGPMSIRTFCFQQAWSHNDNDSVTNMLHDLKWPTLQTRRKYFRLILLFKVINNILLIAHQYLPPPAKLTTTRANYPNKLFHYQPSNDTYQFSFSQELFQNGTNCKLLIYTSCHLQNLNYI